MSMRRGQKLNRLQHLLPEGLLADAHWLEAQGYSSTLRSKYVARGWLEQPARGVFTRPGGVRRWEQVVISLQSVLRLPVAVGGRSALQLHGYGHHLPLGGEARVLLYTECALPGWLGNPTLDVEFDTRNARRLFSMPGLREAVAALPSPSAALGPGTESAFFQPGLQTVPWSHHDWPLLVSTPERAILELLDELPDRETFESVDVLMEGLRTLRPRQLQAVLEACVSVKVNRLFLWFAERHGHPWLRHLNTDRVRTGSGKRVIATGGRLDRKYLITVPEALHGDA